MPGLVEQLQQKYPSLFPPQGSAPFADRLQQALGTPNPLTSFLQHPVDTLNAVGADGNMWAPVPALSKTLATGLSLPGKAVDYVEEKTGPIVDRASLILGGATTNDMADYKAMKEQELAAALKPYQDAAAAQQNNQNAFTSALASGLMGDASGSAAPIQLGQMPAGMYDVPNIPMPTPDMKPDYTKVRDLVEQMRPEAVDEQSYDDTKGMAILAGVAAGILNSNGDVGDMLLRVGLGSLAGVATVDQAKQEAKDKFKQASRQYLQDAINVESSAAKDDAQFATQVWEAQTRRAIAGYQASQERKKDMQPTLVQSGNKMFVKSVDEKGLLTLKPITDAPTLRFERVAKTLQGLGMDEKEAEATAIQAAAGDDPTTMLPTMAVGLLHKRGQIEALWNTILQSGEAGKQLKSRYDQLGMTSVADPTQDAGKAKDEAKAAKDMLLIHTLQQSPYLMSEAMRLSGMPSLWGKQFDATVRGIK